MAGVRPAAVKQGDSAKCWAACMEAWSYVSWYWPNTDMNAFVSQYGDKDGALDASSSKFAQFLDDWKLNLSFFDAGKFTADAASSLINASWAYFMFIEKQSPTTSHARLAWDLVGGQLKAMEPAEGQPDFITGPPEGLGKLMIFSHL